jgi:hypothetical protein
MALDDRERTFEKALARRLHVRAAAAACPDAETLAAYYERLLTAEEMGTWKQHTAACVSCQEILAQLEATDAIPLGADAQQNAAVEGAKLFEGVYIAEEAPKEAALSPEAPLLVKTKRTAAGVSLRQSPRHPRATRWRWLAPAGALAAGLLAWVAVHERQPAKVTQPAKIEVAENRPPALAPPIGAPTTMERGRAEKTLSTSKTGADGADRTRAANVDEPKNHRAEAARNEILMLSPGVAAKSDRKDAGSEVTGRAREVTAEGGSFGGVVDAPKLKQPAEQPAQGRPQTDLTQSQAAPAPPSAGRAGALPQAELKPLKKPLPEAAASETLALSSGSRDASALRMAKSRFPRSVSAPGGKVIWHLGMAGLIEQSMDGGLTWTPQTSGTTADLFLGSAPSEQVCWVIGNGGTILRTADSGSHWISVASPILQNLYLIRASDALHATVWDASRRISFTTGDGGVTWTQVSSQ